MRSSTPHTVVSGGRKRTVFLSAFLLKVKKPFSETPQEISIFTSLAIPKSISEEIRITRIDLK